MITMKKILNKRRLTIALPVVGALALVAVLLVATGVLASPLPLALGQADESAAASIVPTSIFYQGRITDAAGDPITGTYVMTFSLYTQLSGGTSLAQDMHSVQVSNGLFRTYMTFPVRGRAGGGRCRDVATPLFAPGALRPQPAARCNDQWGGGLGAASVEGGQHRHRQRDPGL